MGDRETPLVLVLRDYFSHFDDVRDRVMVLVNVLVGAFRDHL